VATLAREFGCRPDGLIAAAGPSIGACCYEVGADVRQRFEAAGFTGRELARWFFREAQPTARNRSMDGLHAPRDDHWYFDGWAATRDQLANAGLPPGQIHTAELCTASHPQ